jgi:hypothetical protein
MHQAGVGVCKGKFQYRRSFNSKSVTIPNRPGVVVVVMEAGTEMVVMEAGTKMEAVMEGHNNGTA